MKKLSVIVPSYNFGKYLIECIDSIYKQKTNFDFDVIVRDDNSPDNSKQVLNYLQNKYKSLIVLDGSLNLGGFQNIKLLYESTNSEYIAYLDGDDIFGDDDKLQRQVDFLDQNPEYVMTFTGCRYLYEDGRIHPNDSRVICSLLDVISTKNLLEKNYVGFGRVFRNIPNILKKEYENLPYVDWPMSYELSKHGLIYYDGFFGGLYRISDEGVYSKLPEEEKAKGADFVRSVINKNYWTETQRTITIIDSFINNDIILQKLKSAIHNLKERGNPILLVSNLVPPKDTIEKIDYFIYNHENKLFKKQYKDLKHVDLWKGYNNLEIHEITEEFQKHGLSVLCNLFNCLDLAKSLGYTHFQRIEVDDLYKEDGYNFMKSIPELCLKEDKKSLFYINEEDVSFHFFFSEINFFLENFTRIRNEDDYVNYLKSFGSPDKFKPAEVYLYDHIKKINSNSILLRDGKNDMESDFEGTEWNTESSPATIHEKFRNCSTKIYNVKNSNDVAILSFNYNNYPVRRKIVVQLENSTDTIHQYLEYYCSWSYNIYNDRVIKISVYDLETEEFLYEMENDNILDFIVLK